MTESEIRAFKVNLQDRQAAIHNSASKRDDIVIQQAADSFDEVQLNAERNLTIALLNHDAALLQNLKLALRRIEDGSFGVCLQCEEEISPKRLKAVPWAMFCLGCQEESDSARAAAGAAAREDD